MHNAIAPKIACIGAGYWGQNLVRNFHQLGALGCVCDGDREQVARLRAKYPDVVYSGQHPEVLGDPMVTAVAIATPAVSHGALVREALLAGKHVFVEKPLCLSLSEARQLIDLAAER